MAKIPFSEKEMTIAAEVPSRVPGGPSTQVYSFPCTPKEGMKALYEGHPQWALTGVESGVFCPAVIPDDVARGFVFEATPYDRSKFGGPDMFGVEWEFVPLVGGSMVRPGKPLMEDANDWEKLIKFPDIDSWDWEGSAKANKEYLNNGKANMFWFLNGAWYERLISFMDFEGAAMALIDEDQQDAVKALFEKTTDLYCRIVDKCCETYGDGISGFTVHDDWGAQFAPFFSPAVGAEMIVPYMKKLTDHIKSKGMIADLHSCGKLEAQVKNFADAGWQSWTGMPMNDSVKCWELVGDRMLIGVAPDEIPADASYEEQVKNGENFVKKYFQPGKYALVNASYYPARATRGFREGLYRASRQQ